MSPENKKKQTN